MHRSILARGVTLIDGTGRDPVRHAAVLIVEDRIEYAGPDKNLPDVPADTYTLAATGLTLLPGLMNLHVHLAADEDMRVKLDAVAREYDVDTATWLGVKTRLFHEDTYWTLIAYSRALRCLDHGITLIRDLGAAGWGLVKLKYVINAGRLKGPRLLVCGKNIGITGGHMYYHGEQVDGPYEFAKAAREQLREGCDFIKIVAEASTGEGALSLRQPEMTLEEIRAATRVAHQAGCQIAAHAHTPVAIKLCLDAGVDVIEHGIDLDEACITQMVAQGTWLVPTLQVYHRILAARDNPALAPSAARARDSLQRRQRSLERAISAGVKIACGTDGGSPNNPPELLVPELQGYVDAGMTPMEALQTATKRAAEMIGRANDLGTIEAGKLADIIGVPGDPLSDLAVLNEVQIVIKGGEILVDRAQVACSNKTGRTAC
jgi:imidazolonepropionase-like amidohydrolase